ncbi:MAG: hypothetical protein KF678_10745 [Phycisphaeraceae bacterium]|nr:hypothetical protein [Phycisphaeraceae bacterium]
MPSHPPTSLTRSHACPGCGSGIEGFTVGDACPNCGRRLSGLCRACGYDLQGLTIDSPCPECAKPIADSLRGDLLIFADRAYLLDLYRGAVFILVSIILVVSSAVVALALGLAVASGTTLPVLSDDAVNSLIIAITFIASALSIYGWYLLSQRDPGIAMIDPGDRPRRILRIAVVINGALAVLSTVIDLLTPSYAPAAPLDPLTIVTGFVMLAGFAAWAVQFFAAMRYLQWLGRRVPDPGKVKRAGLYLWLLPVLYIPGVLLCGLGPLIALILYYNFLNDYRKILKRIIAQQPAA